MSRLSLYLLGPPHIELDGEPVQVDTRKAIALLAYLALTGERHRRDSLVNLLWPESDQSHGRAALRRTLSALRKALPGDWLDAGREDVALYPAGPGHGALESVPGQEIWLDIDQFHNHLAACRAHDHPVSDTCPACLPHLAAAAALHRGDFMCGFGLRDSFNFDDWQFFQSEGLRGELAETLERLVRCHCAQGDLESAIDCARRWLDLDRLNEAAHGQLMLLYTWLGRRSAALRQYQECTRILESNLGVSPQASTLDLYRAIVEGHAPAAPGWPAPPAEVEIPVQPRPGMAVDPAQAAGLVSQPLPAEGEKHIVSVLVVDASASIAELGKLGAEDEALLVSCLLQVTEDVLRDVGGHVDHALGQSVVGALGTWGTHESDPELAIRAALRVRGAARELGLDAAVGVNTGEIYAGPAGGGGSAPLSLTGSVVDLAVRLAGAASAGQILVGGSTHHLARHAFAFTPLALDMSGIKEPVVAYRVERLRRHPIKARGIEGLWAELIGRDRELARLQDALARVLHGQGQMVSIIGEAGVGKSRLVAELREIALAPSDNEVMPVWLEGRCLELGTPTGYAPLIDMLREYLAWRPGEETRRRRESIATCLRRMVERGDLAPERAQEMGPVLGRLLSLRWGADTNHPDEWDDRLEAEGPDQVRRRTFAALDDFFLALSRQRPLVLVFEDLHWADTLSLDLISMLMEGLSQRPLLLLAVYRPEREHRCWHLATIAAQKCGARYTELTLRELTGPQSQRMAESLLASESLPVEVRDLVLRPSQGNPFFIEEVAHSLIDAGIVYRDGATWHVRPGRAHLAVPEGVQSVILSRVDRLDERLRHVLQAASVIGRAFRRRVLAHTIQDEPDLQSALWELEERALVYQERAVPEVEYSFRHVLTQEAVYHNITRRRRQDLHRQVAQAIEALYAQSLEQYSEQLAHHYDQAGDAAKAVEYLLQAGEKAWRSYANEEAITHLSRGLELLQTLPVTPERDRQELDLLVSLGVPLVLTKGHAALEVQRTYAWALELSERLGDMDQRFHALLGLRRFYLLRDKLDAAYQFGERLLALAQHTRDPGQLARAHMMHAETMRLLGEFPQVRNHCEEGLAHYNPQQRRSHVYLYGNDTGIGCRIGRAQALWYLGYPDAAAREAEELLVLAHELAHPFTLVFALHSTASVRQLLREAQIVQQQEEAVIRISQEHGFSLYLSLAKVLHGWALAAQGALQAGIKEMQAGITDREDSGIVTLFSDQLTLLAEVYGQAGRTQEALDLLDEALRQVAASGERNWLAEMHRLRGDLLAAGEDAARAAGQDPARGATSTHAEACLERALDVARCQHAKSWELRAATSLARLWQRQGKTQEARALLQEVYGWFSEGFGSADLVEARALLDAL